MTIATSIVEPVYRDHIHAIRCALSVSAQAFGNKPAKWQSDYQAGYRVSSIGPNLTRQERFQQDCMTRHLLHVNLSPVEWSVIVIRFAPATHFQGRAIADSAEVAELETAFLTAAAHMPCDLGEMFAGWCLMRWARRLPAGRGEWKEWYGKNDLSERTIRQRGYDIYKEANQIEDAAKRRVEQLCKEAGLIC